MTDAPNWTAEEKVAMQDRMVEMAKSFSESRPLVPVDQRPIDCFTTFFADWEIKEQDLLVHLYPRDGENDVWTKGHYEPHCANCGATVEIPKTRVELKPCPRCRHTGLKYIPGRTETPPDKVEFPKDMDQRIKQAADAIWMGDVAIDLVPELKSYVVQFQRASVSAKVLGEDKFVDKFCERLDQALERK